jgi:hypothetical protein
MLLGLIIFSEVMSLSEGTGTFFNLPSLIFSHPLMILAVLHFAVEHKLSTLYCGLGSFSFSCLRFVGNFMVWRSCSLSSASSSNSFFSYSILD